MDMVLLGQSQERETGGEVIRRFTGCQSECDRIVQNLCFPRSKDLSYYVRPMTKDDVAPVTEIDREAFPTQWPQADYNYEIKNRLAHYIVACDDAITIEKPKKKLAPNRLWALLRRLFRRRTQTDNTIPSVDHYIVGFAGFWIMAGEVHITSIAVREARRRQGIGELLLIAVVDMAQKLKVGMVTLEVRVSNIAAQNLYTKYGFAIAGRRKGYYIDRGHSGDSKEDGLIMTTEDINSAVFEERLRQLRQAHSQRWGVTLAGSRQ
jgi:ribosomal-protein-alanine N-acetyltransferase